MVLIDTMTMIWTRDWVIFCFIVLFLAEFNDGLLSYYAFTLAKENLPKLNLRVSVDNVIDYLQKQSSELTRFYNCVHRIIDISCRQSRKG